MSENLDYYRKLYWLNFFCMLLICFVSVTSVSDSAESTNKIPEIEVATKWNPDSDIRGWWMSEKLDGVRGYWTGTNMISRSGRKIALPDWFTKKLPPFPLDGELWTKRGDFSTISSIIRRQKPHNGWQDVTYCIFEVPDAQGVFHERLNKAKAWFKARTPSHVIIIKQVRCRDQDHLLAELKKIDAVGGEGLILRQPNRPYKPGRSEMLKVKTFYNMEAVVIDHNPGRGKHEGRLGSLLVELSNGIRFSLGTGFTDQERENPPPVGSTVIFKYKEFNKSGVPRFAFFLQIKE